MEPRRRHSAAAGDGSAQWLTVTSPRATSRPCRASLRRFPRRRAVLGAVALAAAPVAALPALASPVDPVVDMYRRAKAFRAVHDHPDTSEKIAEAAYEVVSEMRADAFETAATTPIGALASLQWARDEFAEYYVEYTDKPDWLDIFTLKMIDNAIAVLQGAANG